MPGPEVGADDYTTRSTFNVEASAWLAHFHQNHAEARKMCGPVYDVDGNEIGYDGKTPAWVYFLGLIRKMGGQSTRVLERPIDTSAPRDTQLISLYKFNKKVGSKAQQGG